MEKRNMIWKAWLSKALLTLCLVGLSPLMAQAQGIEVVRGDCTPDLADDGGVTRGVRRGLPTIRKDWDATKVYKQMVILVTFRDVDFQSEDPRAFFNSIFNEKGYNQRNGVGCVADYFRDQSGGLFNLVFDIYGPIKLDTLANPYAKPTKETRNYGKTQFRAATSKVLTENPDIDYRQYDWNGDGQIEQVIFVYAGMCGNQGDGSYGFIWPNTSSFTTITTKDGVKISNFTASGELWKNNYGYCGIGTICHEFTHSLGLPDIYPTSSGAGFSVVDEWDLMDGGNFTNYGWCPPNYSPLEKMLLGWLEPIELTDPVSVKDLKPSSESGKVYQIKHSDNEWLLLENRQQRGWDLGAPGKGLVIYHVDYDKSAWSGNTVNNNKDKRRFELVHADNLDYEAWDALVTGSPYVNKPRLNSRILSTSPYPWQTDSSDYVNSELTDNSVPPAKMNYSNRENKEFLGKPITNISMSDDGLISFDFMGGDQSGIMVMPKDSRLMDNHIYDLQGRRVTGSPGKGVYIVEGKKVIIQ